MTAEIAELVELVRRMPDCVVRAPSGQPLLPPNVELPADLEKFYRLAGGMTFFGKAEYPVSVVAPEELVRANPVLCPGFEDSDDISKDWYIVATCGSRSEAITVDLHPERLGRCYDSFWDVHAVAGSCSVIALSFTSLLGLLLSNGGDYWFWLDDEFAAIGDAYD